MTEELVTSQEGKQLEITESNGRTTIVFRKAILKGKVGSSDVLNTIMIAAKLQAEGYIKKLSQGILLEAHEVKALKELSEITKLEISDQISEKKREIIDIDAVKTNLRDLLAEKLSKNSSSG